MKKLLLMLCFFIGLAACSNGPTQEEVMEKFVSAWNDGDFTLMYTYLSSESKEKIEEETFVERYQSIYKGVEAENLTVEAGTTTEEEGDDTPKPFHVTMDTVAGTISFDGEAEMVQEETDDGQTWRIHWDASFIFPQLNDGQTVQVMSEEPERGNIYDRNDRPLAMQSPVKEAGLVPGKMTEDTASEIAAALEMEEDDITSALEADWVTEETFVPLKKLRPDGKDSEAEEMLEIDGVMIQEASARFYPYKEKAAHLTGYIQEVTAEDLEELPADEYGTGSVVGKAGLESIYEEKLHGSKGWRIYIPESETVIAEKEVEHGEDVKVSIDAAFQENMYDSMQNDAGAGVALDPKTGETLALVSTPSYDPNHFVFGWPRGAFTKASEHPDSPFSARFNNRYSPGSTIKPLTASAALQAGSLHAEEAKTIEGRSWQPNESWGGYKVTRVSDALTRVDLKDALITSDNIYFAQAALDTGSEAFSEGLKRFGFEEEVPYQFPVAPSSIANDELDDEMLLADTGYGQGQMLMSPIHVAAAFTAFINEGDMLEPTLLSQEEPREVWHEQAAPAEHLDVIREGMQGIVENHRGSAYQPVMEQLTIAGKTGTAELKRSQTDENTKENGWFAAYDYEKEDLLMVMMIEGVQDKGGSTYTVEKVKQLFAEWKE
ncbi:penicillin-binding protein [Alteribacillus persepolensis]|uniref:serine-type D-Ala-D-Ala carboxypeptidase n=1 Tax=Alteribacillus persepolensis TaxID=568899 RepID=A0A1G8B484_9BACI|nr:penicillin-binding transpeptidase domain-containing protein [Alteribacillus persepolensis]SDH27944.1 penicillin-binding protein [Alteribacillus persepolensis]